MTSDHLIINKIASAKKFPAFEILELIAMNTLTPILNPITLPRGAVLKIAW